MKLKPLFLFLLIVYGAIYSGFSQETQQKVSRDTLQIDKAAPLSRRHYSEDFKEAYNSDAYQYETTSKPNGWFARFKAWLIDLVGRLFAIENQVEAGRLTTIISRVFYFLVVLAVIYFIVKAVLNKEGRWVFGKRSDKKTIQFEDVESNIYKTDFNTLIAEATATKNYRLAIRYYYLWLLKELSEKEFIEYDVEKTNSDYFNELQNEELKSKFSYASYLYNYIWYGEFSIQAEQYNTASNRFENFIKNIKK
ncbi:DUF4129 domain-containing protein [Galbibacter sp. PAP.153]|uniref:DUF4129 domain-containing protein n=1 Tax=Galbibacter sp. PAP.153 TaxID=3104623 RepID=UPI003009C5C4